ncbi:16S rRNA (adenine(1518)-N(6)/adenine(1519)-N(6)) -dimethyltransferase RsmA [Desulfovibrionales bacterium]
MFQHPKRSLGQNFLCDPQMCQRIVAAIPASPEAPILEIGPGRGALTKVLVGRPGPIFVLEKDNDLARWVRSFFPGVGVILGDGLEFCWEQTAAMPGLSLVGNLPYNVASPMIWEMLSRCRAWHSMVFMVQKEVALRLTAHAGSRTYGALSAWVANFALSSYLFTVPPQVFRPQPKVESAIVCFRPHPAPAWEERRALSLLLKRLFQQRRKQLGTILKAEWGNNMEAWCLENRVDRSVRPEMLTPDQLRSLSAVFSK